jgi:hypothetical protein
VVFFVVPWWPSDPPDRRDRFLRRQVETGWHDVPRRGDEVQLVAGHDGGAGLIRQVARVTWLLNGVVEIETEPIVNGKTAWTVENLVAEEVGFEKYGTW